MTIVAIAMDGPAGAGKSTLAKGVAAALQFLYIDTGAMYRAVALHAWRLGTHLEDAEAMGEVARQSVLTFSPNGTHIFLNGEDVSEAIRTPEITRITRFAARAMPVREELVRRQRAMALEQPSVMEGRDITTVVLPEAKWKFFVTATPEERARRRFQEFAAAGHSVSYEEILREILDRDASDHAVGPLKDAFELAHTPGSGIRLLDTTSMTPEEAVQAIVSIVRAEMQ